MPKKQVYLNEYNLEVGNSVFLPYSTGLLQAYAQRFDIINENYEFKPIIFRKDTVENIVAQYDTPDVVGFSSVIWNHQLNLAVAKELKKKFPECIIIFGGPCITKDVTFLAQHPFIDFAVYCEGEKLFTHTLLNHLKDGDYYGSEKYYLTHWTNIFYNHDPSTNLDIFPSPYLSGVYDEILQNNPDIEFKALVECNRNCPFGCDYCFWGQPELEKRIKYHSPEYIAKDAEWIAQHKIDYVFCTDANFGMFKRDVQTAKIFAKTKKEYGYPEKFRVCYGKNAANTIFETASILNNVGMDKLITLSVQSTNPDTLKAVNRKNISQKTFETLQQRYLDANISTYTEFILGLPCETKQSFYDGLEQTIRTIGPNQIFVYPCLVLPNTKLDSQEYRGKYGLITRKLPMKVPHSNVVDEKWVTEWDEVIVGTNTMPIEDWIECSVMSWTIQLLHSLKVGYDVVEYLHQEYSFSYIDIYKKIIFSDITEIKRFWQIAQDILDSNHWSQHNPIFGDIYYEPEELAYLNILYNKHKFFDQLLEASVQVRTNNFKTCSTCGELCLVWEIDELESQLPNTDNVVNWKDFAINTIIRGGKDNKKTNE